MKRILLFSTILLALISNNYLNSQTSNHVFDKSDSVIIRELYNMALSEGESYENLRYLCKEIGARITGSTEAQMAVEWGQKIMTEYGF
ncbi:MAG: peptidase M28 family protein, partial [Flavobacteriales bacterium]